MSTATIPVTNAKQLTVTFIVTLKDDSPIEDLCERDPRIWLEWLRKRPGILEVEVEDPMPIGEDDYKAAELAAANVGDDLCDSCSRSHVVIDHYDEDDQSVCLECAAEG